MGRPEYDETTGAKLIYGHDGENDQAVHTDSAGNLIFSSEFAGEILDVANNILMELRIISHLLNEGMNVKEELEDVRYDEEDELDHE